MIADFANVRIKCDLVEKVKLKRAIYTVHIWEPRRVSQYSLIDIKGLQKSCSCLYLGRMKGEIILASSLGRDHP